MIAILQFAEELFVFGYVQSTWNGLTKLQLNKDKNWNDNIVC